MADGGYTDHEEELERDGAPPDPLGSPPAGGEAEAVGEVTGEVGGAAAGEPGAAIATAGGAGSRCTWYAIGDAARRAGVHEQTLRHYERLGLIAPARRGTRPQSPRLYSDQDIERVIHIRRLMVDLGVNLAGVETILHMRDRMEALQRAHAAEVRRLRAIIEGLQR